MTTDYNISFVCLLFYYFHSFFKACFKIIFTQSSAQCIVISWKFSMKSTFTFLTIQSQQSFHFHHDFSTNQIKPFTKWQNADEAWSHQSNVHLNSNGSIKFLLTKTTSFINQSYMYCLTHVCDRILNTL